MEISDFGIKLILTFLLSGTIFFVMMKIQSRKDQENERKFRQFLKSKGINPDLEG